VPIDAERLTAILAEHEQRLRRFVVGVLGDRAAAEDVVQIAFARAVESGEEIRPEALKSWLYRVALNEAVSWRRRQGAARRATAKLAAEAPTGDDERSDQRPEAPLVRSETIEQVSRALEKLTPVQQQVVRARVYGERKFVEIAAEMKVPLPTVITHMRRALEKLRQHLKRSE